MANDRLTRKEQLLAAARDRLVDDGRTEEDSGPEIRYRGKVVRQGTGRTPGAGGGSSSSSGGSDDVRAALEKIKGLYRDGLISRAEAEKKRQEILDRL